MPQPGFVRRPTFVIFFHRVLGMYNTSTACSHTSCSCILAGMDLTVGWSCWWQKKNVPGMSRSFRSLASEGFPSRYLVFENVSACTQKAPNLRFLVLKRCLTNTPRPHRIANGQLSSLTHPRQVAARLAPPL